MGRVHGVIVLAGLSRQFPGLLEEWSCGICVAGRVEGAAAFEEKPDTRGLFRAVRRVVNIDNQCFSVIEHAVSFVELPPKAMCPCDLREKLGVVCAVSGTLRDGQQFLKGLLGFRRIVVVPESVEVGEVAHVECDSIWDSDSRWFAVGVTTTVLSTLLISNNRISSSVREA